MYTFARSLPLIAVALVAGFTSPARARATGTGGDRLANAIANAIPEKKYPGVQVGIAVQSVTTGDWLYERGADTQMIPASVCKVFTAYTALKRLKPTNVFSTQVFTQGTLKEGLLQGDLYLKGGGDPSLVSERMWMLVNDLVRTGIKSINGNLIADSSYFDEEKNPASRPKYLKDQAYNAPIGALSFNFNTTTIFVRPGEVAGSRPVVYTDPENSYIDVVNQATTGPMASDNSLVVSRTNFVEGDLGDTVLLRGSLPVEAREQRFYRNIVNPALYTLHMFKTFWEQRGLKFSGSTKEGVVPSGAKEVLEFDSQPIWQIVWGMNKFSNNFVADQLLKKVGAVVKGAPGTMDKGVEALEETLAEIGIARGTYKIRDGSGLTRETKVTPRQVVKVLKAAHSDFYLSPEFTSSLGVAGEDGTVRNRMSSGSLQGLLRAKTGSLDGVTALAGYVPSADGELLAFAILLNDPKVRYGRMTAWADAVAKTLGNFSRRKK